MTFSLKTFLTVLHRIFLKVALLFQCPPYTYTDSFIASLAKNYSLEWHMKLLSEETFPETKIALTPIGIDTTVLNISPSEKNRGAFIQSEKNKQIKQQTINLFPNFRPI